MTRQELIIAVAKACLERAKVQNWRGDKTRTDKALDYLCGAAAALNVTGHVDTSAVTLMAFMVSIRGYSEVERFAQGD